MSTYTFDVKALFLIAKLIKHFDKEVSSLKKILLGENMDTEFLFDVFFNIISALPEAQSTAIELLAHVSRRDVKAVENLDAYQFLKEFREFVMAIDWEKLLGESLGLKTMT